MTDDTRACRAGVKGHPALLHGCALHCKLLAELYSLSHTYAAAESVELLGETYAASLPGCVRRFVGLPAHGHTRARRAAAGQRREERKECRSPCTHGDGMPWDALAGMLAHAARQHQRDASDVTPRARAKALARQAHHQGHVGAQAVVSWSIAAAACLLGCVCEAWEKPFKRLKAHALAKVRTALTRTYHQARL